MDPTVGIMLYLVATTIVSVIASKRGRSGSRYFILCIAGGMGLARLVATSGGTGFAAGALAFLVPLIALLIALSTKTSEQVAREHGSHGKYKKCPFCAEAIRKEAIKCKHCGSDLSSGEAES